MEVRKATREDFMKVYYAVGRKDIPFCTPYQINVDWVMDRLYVVAEGDKVYACLALVEEPMYHYTALKRLCLLNKKNRGKGIARFATREIQKFVKGKIGATPWEDNMTMRHILESDGFRLEYKFDVKWCFYSKEIEE